MNPRRTTSAPGQERFREVVYLNEAQGGRHLPDVHRPREILYKIPRNRNFPNGSPMPPKRLKESTAGCGAAALLDVPHPDGPPVRVCIIDDAVDRWPRFRGTVPA